MGTKMYKETYSPESDDVRKLRELFAHDAYLVCIYGPYLGKRFRIDKSGIRIGRDKTFNEIVLDQDSYTSRRHATITYRDGKYFISDKRSRARTFVNNQVVNEDEEVLLQANDEIEIGKNIFRFVFGENWDFSYPKKAGIFWIRNQQKIRWGLSLLLILLSLWIGYRAIYSWLVITSNPSYPLLSSNTVRITFEKPVNSSLWLGGLANTNSSKEPEYVFAASTGDIYAYNFKKNKILWSSHIGERINADLSLADVNQDGFTDVVVIADNYIKILNGINGSLLYQSRLLSGQFKVKPAIGDLNGDNFRDVVALSIEGQIYIMYLKPNGSFFQEVVNLANLANMPTIRTYSTPVIRDFNSDGRMDIILGDNLGNIWVIDGLTRTKIRQIPTRSLLEQNRNLPIGSVENEIRSAVLAYDINDDGYLDLFSLSRQNNLVAVDGAKSILLWEYQFPLSITGLTEFSYSPALIDVEGDGQPEIVITLPKSNVIYLFDCFSENRLAKLLWWEKIPESSTLSPPSFCDINKDNIIDIVLINDKNTVYVLNSSKHVPGSHILTKAALNENLKIAPVLIGDINSDEKIEFLLRNEVDTPVYITTRSRYLKNTLLWNSSYNNSQNSNIFIFRPNPNKYLEIAAFNILIILIVVTTNWFIYRHRLKLIRRYTAV